MSSVATATAPHKAPESRPMSNSLVRPGTITTPEQYLASLQEWQQQKFHILTPFANISALAHSHGIMTTVVQINGDKTAGDVYDGLPFLKAGEQAIAKNGLRKIAEGLGISTELQYISVGAIRNYWHVKAIARYRGIDGATVTREASMEWDLRDGSDRLKGWRENQISEARKHGLRACETRALNAVIRECGAGIKQAYRKEELERPFVAVRVVHQPDMSDPEIRRMVAEHALKGTHALYAPTSAAAQAAMPAPPADPFADADVHEPRHVGSGSTTPASTASAPAAPAAPAAPTFLRVVKVTTKHGQSVGQKDGKPVTRDWTLYRVELSDQRDGATFDAALGQLAQDAQKSGAPVRVVLEDTERGTKLTSLEIASTVDASEPDLPLDIDGGDL